MAKVAIINDTHFGARADSQILSEYMGKFYRDVFFPYIDEHKIEYVRHLGDLGDRRKYINHLTAHSIKAQFIKPCLERGIDLGILIGNHDSYFKNTNEINTMESLFHGRQTDKFKWYADTTIDVIDGIEICLIPWICPDNFLQTMEIIKSTTAQIAFGHLEIAGFEMYRGSTSEAGFDSKIFNKFDVVLSGHYHHKSTKGNINYLGAPYEMTWSDYDDVRGFHIFDTTTRALEYIVNPYHLFQKISYNDAGKQLSDILDPSVEHLSGTYVKMIVHEKTNPYWFDMFVDKVEQANVADLQIIELDSMSLSDLETENVGDSESTIDIIRRYASNYMSEKDPTRLGELNEMLTSLYNEAVLMETDRT